ncbi:hypothetical protein T261_03107 [Streptomyces lydicus]|nr:hypothetical protein T261_03107 [Streptomyces lydicus]
MRVENRLLGGHQGTAQRHDHRRQIGTGGSSPGPLASSRRVIRTRTLTHAKKIPLDRS